MITVALISMAAFAVVCFLARSHTAPPPQPAQASPTLIVGVEIICMDPGGDCKPAFEASFESLGGYVGIEEDSSRALTVRGRIQGPARVRVAAVRRYERAVKGLYV